MKKNQNILWMIDGLGAGGAEQLMPATLKHLKDAGFNIRICALQIKNGNPIASELERIGLPVDLLLIQNLRHPLNFFRIIRYLHLYRPKILHTQLEFADILGTLAAKLLGIPVVSTLHSLDDANDPGTARWRHKLRWYILRHFTDRIISVSEKTRQHHINSGRIDSSKIITIYNGIELERFKQIQQEKIRDLKQSLGILNSKVITTIAVLREPKGIQHMLEALPIIINKIPNVKYLIVGDGDHKPVLLSLVKHLHLSASVVFAGQRTDIPNLLACSDLFVLPTLKDALPTVLIESLAAEKPIVASNVGGVPEIIDNGINGILIPPGNPKELALACNKILSDPKLGDDLVLAGRKIVQTRFDVRMQIEQLAKIYQELINQHG